MARHGKHHPGKSRKVSPARGAVEGPVQPSTGAPLVVAVVLIAAIAAGLGYSVFKRNQKPSGIGAPATSMESTPAPATRDGSAAPAEDAAPKKSTPYGTELTN